MENAGLVCIEWLDRGAPSMQESRRTERLFEPKVMVQLSRLAEFKYQYFEEGVGGISVGHSD
jgi:hypothetical protein